MPAIMPAGEGKKRHFYPHRLEMLYSSGARPEVRHIGSGSKHIPKNIPKNIPGPTEEYEKNNLQLDQKNNVERPTQVLYA